MYRFHDLAWVGGNDTDGKGIVAGALDNGNLGLWDVDKTLSSGKGVSISNEKIHTGAIKALQFNPKISNLLATGGAKGELFISDLDRLGSPVRLGSTAARADDIDCLDWNKRVSHIMVTGSSGGFVTVWDMKTKKESLTLNNSGRKAVSAVAWDPEKPTRLITAVPLEQEPVILVWDLRNSNAPEKTLRGHDSGVLSLSWCPQDSDLLLSCGKDNRTMLWNPQTGQSYGDYPVVTNWTFQTRWNPHNPNFFATASFDGKLQVQTLQNTNASSTQSAEQGQAGDGEDFFSKAQSQPQSSSFSLATAPKWLERPVSVSFGFGGRLVSVKTADIGKRTSSISISKFEVDSSVGEATDNFEKALQSGDLVDLVQMRISESKSDEERADWEVMRTLVSRKPREELVKYLGFGEAEEAADGIAQLGLIDEKADSLKPQVNGAARGHKRFSSMFDSTPEGDFLSELAASKATRTNNPFQIYTGSESEADRRITRALMLGQFDKALDVCLEENRMADAFMFATCGGDACIKKAQEAYFAKQDGGPNYLRLLAPVVGKNLWDVVYNADIANWKETMTTLCTFADEKEFSDLCEALGDRLEETSTSTARKDASFCFLAGSKLEKVVSIWVEELNQQEQSGNTNGEDKSAFSIHARGLQDFIEKVTVFRKVVNFRDMDLQKSGDWKLDTLYAKYVEYADIVAAHGQLAVAQKYLDLVPGQYPEADVARRRLQEALKKPSSARAAVSTTATSAGRQKPLPPVNFQTQTQSPFLPTGPQMTTPYGAPTPRQPPAPAPGPIPAVNPYAPPSMPQPPNPYGPPAGYQPQQQIRGSVPPPPLAYGQFTPQTVPPPPRAYNVSPSIPPPSQDKSIKPWNDLPTDFIKPPTPRKGTPSQPSQPFTSPFPGQQPPGGLQMAPPPPGPPMGPSRTTPAPPPPRGSAPPPRVSSPLTSQVQSPYAPLDGQSSGNSYMPNSSMGQNVAAPSIARGPSPYNAPPQGGAPVNRYAPAPGSQPVTAPSKPSIAPPPQGSSFASPPPPQAQNMYGPPRQQAPPPSGPYAPNASQPPSLSQASQVAPPAMSGPPPQPSSRPGTADSGRRSAAPPARKYRKSILPFPPASTDTSRIAKGDRTHIPPIAQPIYEILSSEMARVKSRAPASFKPQVTDTEKRLDILFDHLNNEDLLKPDTVWQMVELSQSLKGGDFDRAAEIQVEVHRDKVDEAGQWMVGVKRLVGMCRAIGPA